MEDAAGIQEREAIERFLTDRGEQTYAGIFRIFAPRLVTFFRLRGCEGDLAEDLTQEVMLAVYRQSHTLRDKELFRAWIFRIARNALLQHKRSSGRQILTTELTHTIQEQSGAVSDPLLGFRFNEWMSALHADERQIMMLRYIEGLEYHEIAAVLDLPIGTVQWKIHNSKKKLAARFGGPRA